jgi:hypothetical protein
MGSGVRDREKARPRSLYTTAAVAAVTSVTIHASHEAFDLPAGLRLKEGGVRANPPQGCDHRTPLLAIEPEVRHRR